MSAAGEKKHSLRYCVCGWRVGGDKPHRHDEREREAALRVAEAQCWMAHEAEVERRA